MSHLFGFIVCTCSYAIKQLLCDYVQIDDALKFRVARPWCGDYSCCVPVSVSCQRLFVIAIPIGLSLLRHDFIEGMRTSALPPY